MAKQGFIIEWPESQDCISCEHATFVDIVIDNCGSVYICNRDQCIHCDIKHSVDQRSVTTISFTHIPVKED